MLSERNPNITTLHRIGSLS